MSDADAHADGSSPADSPAPRLARKPLGRSDILVPAAIWAVRPANLTNQLPMVVDACVQSAGDWFFIPADLELNLLQRLSVDLPKDSTTLVLGIDGAEIRGRRVLLAERLARLGRANCAAVVLQNVSTDEVKSGVPFHRLYPLRDQGLFRSIWIEAETEQDATWLIESSPASAVIAGYGIADQSIRYRAVPSAIEMGTGLIARLLPPGDKRDLRLIAAEPSISAAMMDLPISISELAAGIRQLANPISEPEREKIWQEFISLHPAPARKSRHGVPDE